MAGLRRPDAQDDISNVEQAIKEGIARARGSGRPEAVLREHVQPVLAQVLQGRGVRSHARDEVVLTVPTTANAAVLDAPLDTRGRADAIYNRFVIEFEPPASLRPSIVHSATKHAISQVQQYLRGVGEETGLSLERLAGCAFDGTWIVYVAWERGSWREMRPIRADAGTLSVLVETLESLSTGRGLTAGNLYEDFGRESTVGRAVIQALFGVFAGSSPTGRTLAMYDQWQLDLGNASGPFSSSDLGEWRSLCDDFGVPTSPIMAPRVLFCLQTYFALLSKLVALIILEGATGLPLVRDLTSKEGIRDGFARLESGALTASTGTRNAIEPGIFSWYVSEQGDAIDSALAEMARLADEYSAEIVEITPQVARDVLKDLYHRLVPRTIRHRLGEFYTPDWLAQRVVNQVTGSTRHLDPGKRVLDPACGSGTFLVEIISRMIETAGGRDPRRTLQQILDNVVGFDLSPLAVQASKVNYLLALSPLLRYADVADPITLPVFLADSVSPPRKGGLLEGDVYVFETSEGIWRLPAPLAQANYLPVVGAVVHEAIANDQESTWVGSELAERLPILERQDWVIIEEVVNLFSKLRDLDRANRNGMWWQLITNAFAPTLQPRFDFIVGNPPWVSWETLPENYRKVNDEEWRAYGLRPDIPFDRRQASANARLDIAMLFVAKCIDRYLGARGRLGFVITASVFQSELAGRGFRRRQLGSGRAYRFVHIDDMSSMAVFDNASNRTSVLIADRQASADVRIPVLRWTGKNTNTIPTSLLFKSVLDMTLRREFYAEAVDPQDPASPLLIMPRIGLSESRPLRRKSPYHALIREGINSRGANGVFFLEVLGQQDNLLLVRNLPSAGRNDRIPLIERLIERGAVRKLLRGEDVAARNASPSGWLLFFHDDQHVSGPLPPEEARDRFPKAFEFAKHFEDILRSRRKFRSFDPTGDAWLGIYSVTSASLAEHKVVIREIASGMIAAPVHDRDVIPDHKLHVIPCGSAREADALSDVLNSRVVDYMVRAFSLSTSITGSFLRYIGVRDLSQLDVELQGDALLAQALGLTFEQLRVLDQIAGAELR